MSPIKTDKMPENTNEQRLKQENEEREKRIKEKELQKMELLKMIQKELDKKGQS